MKRLLATLVVVVLVAYGAFKAGVWWLADQRLAEARQALGDAGVLYRGGIGSGVDGHLVLHEARWQDFRLTQPLEIRRVTFDTRSPVSLLAALIDPARLPAQWTLALDGVALDLDPTMLRNWVTATDSVGEEPPALFQLACAQDPRQQLGAGDLIRMGISSLNGEGFVRQGPAGLDAELNTLGTGSLELDWPGARIRVQDREVAVADGAGPMRLTVRDAGLMRRVSAYCAREAGVEPAQWAARAVNALEQGLEARGLVPSDQLRALYRQWLLEGGELTMELRPFEPLLGIPVRAGQASDTGGNWSIRYNEAEVPGAYLTRVEPVPQIAPAVAVEPVVPPEDPQVEAWFPEPLATADQWIGRRVRVTLSNDNVVDGRLVSVSDRELEVARVVAGGEVAYPMLIRAITNFEVWRRGRAQ